MNEDISNQYLNEYNTLRQELLDLSKEQNSLFTFVFTTVSAIIAFSLQQNNAYIALIPFVFLIPARCRHIFYHEMQLRVATYISIFLESKIEGLNWETRIKSIEIKAKSEKLLPFPGTEIHYYAYSIVGLLTCILYVINLGSSKNILLYMILIPLEGYLIYLDLSLIYKSSKARKNYDKLWEDMKSTIQ